LSKLATIILLLLVGLVAVGCNSTDTPPATYGVYVKSVTVEDDVCTVRLSRSGKGESLQDSVIAVEEVGGSFFDTYIYTVSFDGGATFSAVNHLLTQDVTILEGKEYSTLKIVYDYDTIYKSIKSDGEHSKSGRNYVHSFDVSNGPFEATLTRNIPRQSTWYAVLLGGAGAVIVAFVVAHLVRGKYGRKTQEN
jgi:hypothetical protein